MKQFQTILLGLFGVFIFIGILFFSGAIKIGEKAPTSQQQLANKTVTVWGVFPRDMVIDAFTDLSQANQMNLVYLEKKEESIDGELSEAIASQRGPDLVLAPHHIILKHQSKFIHIPNDKFNERQYFDLFIDESRFFSLGDGIVAFPLLIDPIIFYYNNVSYSNRGIIYPPKTWQEVADYVVSLTRKSGDETILESGLPLGTFNNVNNVKDIISLLLLQAGNPIVSYINTGDTPGFSSTLLKTTEGQNITIAEYVIRFITQFSDPTQPAYSWNRLSPNALEAFASEQAAQYIGYASEMAIISVLNPSLNFDISLIPQPEGAKAKKTYGRMYGVAIVKASKEQFASFQVALLMKDKDFSEKLLNNILSKMPIAPARKDLLNTPPNTKYGPILYSSAIISTAWFDFDYKYTENILEEMITNITRNIKEPDVSINEADAKLNELLN
jgi:ABC-type glycerol-3-phosphate transport system substrate-binding protein